MSANIKDLLNHMKRDVLFEDGHHPGNSTVSTRLVSYDSDPSLEIFEEVLPEMWRERAYSTAITHGRPWGAYITATEAQDDTLDADQLYKIDPLKGIALQATRDLIFNRGSSMLEPYIDALHGTAVWCLSSGVGDQVQYHIDYAELFRYETNAICTPVLAATCHVSPFREEDMEGGVFLASMEGIAHYKRFGYKGQLQSAEALREDVAASASWRRVPFRSNRGILFSGTLPHLSTRIERLPEEARRVILGFNCFVGEDVGASCSRAPEHSDAFNRTVKL